MKQSITFDCDKLDEYLKIMKLLTKSDENVLLSSVLFDLREEGVVLKSTDRKRSGYLTIPESEVVKQEGQGKFTMEVDRLKKWVNNVPHDEVTLEYDPQTQEIHSTSGQAEGYFQSPDPEAFPSTIGQSYEDSVELLEIACGTLKEALSFVDPFVSKSGKFDVAEVKGEKMLGTDKMVLMTFHHPSLSDDFRVKKDDISRLKGFFKKVEKDDPIEVRESENFYFFEAEGKDGEECRLDLSKPYHTLPEIENLPFGDEESETWCFNPKEFEHAVQALEATADEDQSKIEISVGRDMKVSLKGARSTKTSTVSVACERLMSEEESFDFKINYEYLLDVIKRFSEDFEANLGDQYLKIVEDRDQTKKLSIIALARS